MNKKLKYIPIFFALLAIFSFVSAPAPAFAKITPDCGTVTNVKDDKGNIASTSIKECDFSSLLDLINSIISFLLFTLAPSLLAVILCYVGFIFITSGGSSESRTKAKKILKNVIFGYLIGLAAWIIVHTIFSTLGFTGNTFLISK